MGNTRLTSLAGVVLLALITVQVVSALFFALLTYNVTLPVGPLYDVVRPVHFFVGFMLMPLIAIKLASTGYRFARYYGGNRTYHAAGPPRAVPRVIAPVLVGSAVILVASGVEMWSYRNQFNLPWTAIHNVAAFTFVSVVALHIVLHAREAHRNAAADLAGAPAPTPVALAAPAPAPASPTERKPGAVATTRAAAASAAAPPPGAITRRALIGTGIAFGAVLGAGASSWPFQGLGWLEARKTGASALDFPVMNYEGGPQVVDTALWRLRVTGLVSHSLELTEAQLLALPAEEHTYAVNCVDGWTATRTWRGVPVADLLRMAGASQDFTHLLVRSTSGYHWEHQRARMLAAGALIVTHVNGVRLNQAHGYPARLMVPGVMGESNIKWVDGIDVRDGTAENYLGEHLDFKNPTITGRLLPNDPAGRRP